MVAPFSAILAPLFGPSLMGLSACLATAGMVMAVAAANYLAQFSINGWLTWGTPVITATFLINEVTHQRLGPTVAWRVVLWGFMVAVVLSAVVAPWRIALGSGTAFLASQLLDIAIFARARRGLWWLAPLASSTAASIVDTAIFFVIAFAGTSVSWWQLALGDFAIKVGFDLAMLLPFRLAMRRHKVFSAPQKMSMVTR